MKRSINLILTHQGADQINRMLAWWRQYAPEADILLAITSRTTDLARIDHPHKITVDDPRLETSDHQRELQSYTAVFVEATRWLQGQPFDYVHFAEYDQLPLRADFNARQLAQLESERADMLCFGLCRVDDTNQPHYLYHKSDARFHAFWESISVRADRRTVLSMFGSGSFWTRAAFEAASAQQEPFRMYLELWLPTVAHHLGYRVRPFAGPEATGFITTAPQPGLLDVARARGAWTVHPVKRLPPGV